ncbi:hypothetical protein [Chondromyces apiculatus]|uniref:Uncharacterized protein n=1 Tax=Chondromyces apiculatus DSM 436 TaxID=1192034 RepID=A0A017T0Z4_9BACT|nr:hypothetical protein [Chondromyces apiculatus]EYF02515.1 Hypothetical protein CAP_6722 [Chondromyces apiculatus DSM 436]
MGVALASACDPCVAQVCAFDSFCCTTEWDEVCRSAVTTVCGQACPDTCAHDICTTGAALQYGCNPCVTAVCDSDSFCCTDAWDYYCLDEVFFSCGIFCP